MTGGVARRRWRHIGPFALVLAALAGAVTFPTGAWGKFSATTNSSASLAAGSLSPPTNLAVTFPCVLLGVLTPTAQLTWTATPSAATGYHLDRYRGAVLESSTNITPASTTTFTDGLGIHLALSTTYTWHLRAYLNSWVSSNAVVTASTPAICT